MKKRAGANANHYIELERHINHALATVPDELLPGATAFHPYWFVFNSPPQAGRTYIQFTSASQSVDWNDEENRSQPIGLTFEVPPVTHPQHALLEQEESEPSLGSGPQQEPVINRYKRLHATTMAASKSFQGLPESTAETTHSFGRAQKRRRVETEAEQAGEEKKSVFGRIRSFFS
ncbi:hypothetical protein BCR43DRAFT_494865 [Syncephalastrum racemosum]|uniref:Uncharacterized protein n=1 Tax=Syncephalastrum racemosum TaxID=13706 RepID=A0A1X2H8T0_SYNRA|nr:hypothetical protein BCR43DRAFT_494865 [Syncephalastrum racemosum]